MGFLTSGYRHSSRAWVEKLLILGRAYSWCWPCPLLQSLCHSVCAKRPTATRGNGKRCVTKSCKAWEPWVFLCNVVQLAECEHKEIPSVESPFSHLGHPQRRRDAGDQGDLKVQGQPDRTEVLASAKKLHLPTNPVGLPVTWMPSPIPELQGVNKSRYFLIIYICAAFRLKERLKKSKLALLCWELVTEEETQTHCKKSNIRKLATCPSPCSPNVRGLVASLSSWFLQYINAHRKGRVIRRPGPGTDRLSHSSA